MKEMFENPVSWAVGGVASVFGVLAVLVTDPSMSFLAIAQVLVDNASMLFTASSIAGFTIAPEVSQELAKWIQWIALGSGLVIVLKVSADIWDRIKERVTE